MPHFYFELHDGVFVPDDEGQYFPSVNEARDEAIASARTIMRDQLTHGVLCLSEKINILNADRQVIDILYFRDAVTLGNEATE